MTNAALIEYLQTLTKSEDAVITVNFADAAYAGGFVEHVIADNGESGLVVTLDDGLSVSAATQVLAAAETTILLADLVKAKEMSEQLEGDH